MAHNITGARFLSVREPAWHGLGVSMTGPVTAVEAVARSGANQVTIETREMGYRTADGEFTPTSDSVVIIRMPLDEDPQEVMLGTASSGYRVLQNTELAEALDASGLTARRPVETCGVLGKGGGLFICLDGGSTNVAGEEHMRYTLLHENRDGKSALMMWEVMTRVVCQNTLNIAIARGQIKASLTHSATVGEDFRFSLDLLDQVEAGSAAVKDALEALHALTVRKADLDDVLDATYRQPVKGTLLANYERVDDPTKFDPATLARLGRLHENYVRDTESAKVLRAVAVERYDVLCQEFPRHAGTGLGVLNAVAEVADHTRNHRNSGASILGNRAEEKRRCYDALVKLF